MTDQTEPLPRATRGAIATLQQEAPPGRHTTNEFFEWVMSLADRVDRREISPFDALQAVRWEVNDRMQNEMDKLVRTYQGALKI